MNTTVECTKTELGLVPSRLVQHACTGIYGINEVLWGDELGLSKSDRKHLMRALRILNKLTPTGGSCDPY